MPKLSALVFHTLDSVKDDGELLFGFGEAGRVYQLEYGTGDDSEESTWRWKSPWMDMGAPEVVKQFRFVHLSLESIGNSLLLEWSVDDGRATGDMDVRYPAKYTWGGKSRWNDENGDIQGGMVWVSATSIRRFRLMLALPQQAYGERLQLTLSETSAGAGPMLADMEVLFRPRMGRFATGGI